MVKDIKFLTFYSIICPLPPSTVYHRSLVHYLPRRGLIPKAYNTNEYTLPGVLNCFSRYFLFLFFFFFYFYFHFFYLLFFLFYSSFFLSFFFACLNTIIHVTWPSFRENIIGTLVNIGWVTSLLTVFYSR